MSASPTALFPVPWEIEEDSAEPYYFDPMHFPFPASPLQQTTIGLHSAVGLTAMLRELGVPVERRDVLFRNHYRFERSIVRPPTSEDEGRALAAAMDTNSRYEMSRLIERWYSEHLPAITSLIERLNGLDPRATPGAVGVKMLDEADEISIQLWTIHFRVVGPMLTGIQLFDELHADLFGGDETDSHALMVGSLSESIKAAFGLSDLGAHARELGLTETFRVTQPDALLAALEASEPGRAFLGRLQAYLVDYGRRQDLFDITTPTWQEDLTVPLATVRHYVLSGRDERAEYGATARAAEDALATARGRIATFPEPVREQFETLLTWARHGAFMQEEHNFYLDQHLFASFRSFCLRIGEKLATRGVLDTPDDVFMLRREEVVHLLSDPDAAWRSAEVAAVVRSRAAELETARGLTPPPYLGPAPKNPAQAHIAIERANQRFWGGETTEAVTPGEIRGHAGSRGRVTGIARVARTLREASTIQPGEILVAITTMPAWTPLFGIAAAVVTETGGVLSHCAIVAREYGIPAVVGAHGATRRIVTGQRITVDGTSGILLLEDDAS